MPISQWRWKFTEDQDLICASGHGRDRLGMPVLLGSTTVDLPAVGVHPRSC